MKVRALVALTAVLALAGCGGTSAVSGVSATPLAPTSATAMTTNAAASTAATPLPSCGDVPVTNGPSKGLIGASLTGPASAPAASTLDLVVHLRSLDGKPHVFDSGAAPVVILQQGRVVGEYEGAVAASGTETTVTATNDSTDTASVVLSGCPKLPLVDSAPDLTRKPLPEGDYQLVVDLPDLSAKPFGHLVSTPMDLHVTAYPSALPTCGDVPASTGPSAEKVGALLTAPATAVAGSTVQVQVQLRSFRGKAEPLESGLPIEVLIVKDGLVVGRSDGAIAGVGIEVTVPPSGTTPLIPSDATSNKLLNSAVTLSGCPETADSGPSQSRRKALPPGTYQLVADFGDNRLGELGVLVAEPATIQVTAD